MRLLLPILLALCSVASGQTITLPGEVSGSVSAFISVNAQTDGDTVKWLALDPGLNVFPAELLRSTKSTVVSASKAGRYRLICWTAKGDVPSDAAHTVIIVGTPGPDPGPDPDPDPPDPPDPPTPDGLAAKVKQWHSAVNSPRKTTETKALAELYLTLASKVAAGGLTSEDALADEMTQGHVDGLGANARHWFGFIQSLGGTLNATAGIKEKGKIFESVGNALKGM